MPSPVYARFAHVGPRRVVLAQGDQDLAPARQPATSPTPRRYYPADPPPVPPAGTAANQSRVCFACPNF